MTWEREDHVFEEEATVFSRGDWHHSCYVVEYSVSQLICETD
jgi:hypothetical protein